MKTLLSSLALGIGLMQASISMAQNAPVRVAAAVYGQKAEFVQLWVRAINEHPAW